MNLISYTHIPYIFSIIVMMFGLFTVITSRHLLKKLIGLGIFQTSIFLLYVAMANMQNAIAPVLICKTLINCPAHYSNPLPHVLMLTAIVVAVATLAVGLAIIVRIYNYYGTLDESVIQGCEGKNS